MGKLALRLVHGTKASVFLRVRFAYDCSQPAAKEVKLKRLAVLVSTCVLLIGCVNPVPLELDYIVMLTTPIPSSDARCTGFLIDSTTIVTANHCIKYVTRAVNIYGEESPVKTAIQWDDMDVAIVRSKYPFYARSYAAIGKPDKNRAAEAWGMCPHFMGIKPRFVKFKSSMEITAHPGVLTIDVDQWITDALICGGDSGGIIVQNNQVVGLINATEINFLWAMGHSAFSTSGQTLKQMVCGYDDNYSFCKGEKQ